MLRRNKFLLNLIKLKKMQKSISTNQIIILIIVISSLFFIPVFLSAQKVEKKKPTFGVENKKGESKVQCTAICKTGYQCKRSNNKTSIYCAQHYAISLRYKN